MAAAAKATLKPKVGSRVRSRLPTTKRDTKTRTMPTLSLGKVTSSKKSKAFIVSDVGRKKKVVQKLIPDKKPTSRGGPISIPISLTKEMNPKVVIKKCDAERAANPTSSYFEESKKDTFLYKRIQAEDTDSDADTDEHSNCGEKDVFDPSIKLTGKLNYDQISY